MNFLDRCIPIWGPSLKIYNGDQKFAKFINVTDVYEVRYYRVLWIVECERWVFNIQNNRCNAVTQNFEKFVYMSDYYETL